MSNLVEKKKKKRSSRRSPVPFGGALGQKNKSHFKGSRFRLSFGAPTMFSTKNKSHFKAIGFAPGLNFRRCLSAKKTSHTSKAFGFTPGLVQGPWVSLMVYCFGNVLGLSGRNHTSIFLGLFSTKMDSKHNFGSCRTFPIALEGCSILHIHQVSKSSFMPSYRRRSCIHTLERSTQEIL